MKQFYSTFFAILAAFVVIAGVLGYISYRQSKAKGWITAAEANVNLLRFYVQSCLKEATPEKVKSFNDALQVNRDIIAKGVLSDKDQELYTKVALELIDEMKEALSIREPYLIKQIK